MKLPLCLMFLSLVAHAATDGGAACFDVEQRLLESQRALASCADSTRSVSALLELCRARTEDMQGRLGSANNQLDACVSAKEQQCHEVAVMAENLLHGTARGLNGCVSSSTVSEIQTLLNGWFAIEKTLRQIDDYATGVTDILPFSTGATESERRLARILGNRRSSPLWNRRLLIEAFKLTAPRAWAQLRSQGALAVETFFNSRTPLPEALVSEARAEHTQPPGPAGPPLAAALKLSVSYLHVANCADRTTSTECARANELVDLLDNTGPLIVRRRVEEILSAPCSSMNAQALKAWLQDFPASAKADRDAQLQELTESTADKLFHCYLDDLEGAPSYAQWVATRLPAPENNARVLALVNQLRAVVKENDPLDVCGRAVRTLQGLEVEDACTLNLNVSGTIARWAKLKGEGPSSSRWALCHRVATLLWNGEATVIPTTPGEPVRIDDKKADTPMSRLRNACAERNGTGETFERDLRVLASIAHDVGEPVNLSPWRYDLATQQPLERALLRSHQTYIDWLERFVTNERSCEALGMMRARCDACRVGANEGYDCEQYGLLRDVWNRYQRTTVASLAALSIGAALMVWIARHRRARRVFGSSLRIAREHLEGLGLLTVPASFAWLFPSRKDRLEIELPRTQIWERWGQRACAVIAPGVGVLREADVNHAASIAMRGEMRVVFLLHHDSATPELGAVRATLEWAARGSDRAVQVLPLPLSRLTWATRESDLLDLVESTTLRGNPFEVRGPVRSSSQFWNRERLVAGLLTQARSGNWVALTGLRRFGKSSLALEVARRTNGPAAYVDLAGFHHEVAFGDGPGQAVEAVLRTLLMRLTESAKERFPAAQLPPLPPGAIDAPALGAFLASVADSCGRSSGQAPPTILLVFDEVEQLLSAAPENLGRSLDVLSTLVGRLRSAMANPSSPHASTTASAFFCAAMHPLLWAPLSSLGGQSLMGAFPSVCVPALDDDAARAMMRGLGARQGIRFNDDALTALVDASQGVPLLLRRLGTAVLELFDADRARSGALGAVTVGPEGATEAIKKEERGGSPLRVWVESEIAGHETVAGEMLRALARKRRVSADELVKLSEARVLEGFAASGLNRHLAPSELLRRAQEAANVMVRLLAESKLLEAHGDETAPEAYSLPDSMLKRILSEVPPQ